VNNSDSYQKGDTVSIWDNVGKSYDRDKYWKGLENIANLKELLFHIGDPSGKRIIEVGSGSSFTSIALAERGANVAILDISLVSLRCAVAQFEACGMPPPEHYEADALESGLPSDTYDCVWNGGVIEHFFDEGKKRLIKEMLRIAKPGGKVVITVPNAWCWQFQVMQAWQKLRGTWAFGFEDDMSPRRLAAMCEEIGVTPAETYAFNTILGWRWVPVIKKIVKYCRLETLERHCRRSWMGWVSVLVIHKK
jgi:ubiquinone/menaquinone biosynthesis C-methylase UbiE